MSEVIDLNTRKNSKNFVINKGVYDKLLVIMEDNGFSSSSENLNSRIAVFLTKKVIVDYGKRINKDRLNKKQGAVDPIPQRPQPLPKDKVILHVKLTDKENQYLEDLTAYHFFIDDNQRKLYSRFIACVILDKWQKREDKIQKQENGIKKNESSFDEFENISLEPNTENWLGEKD